jgi:hypothetical protein
MKNLVVHAFVTCFGICFALGCSARDLWMEKAFKCTDLSGFSFPSKGPFESGVFPDDCNDGDMILFNGLLCAAGESLGCETVRRSTSATQSEIEGEELRFWRSPRRALSNNMHLDGKERILRYGDSGTIKSFSPDMELGVLLYAVTTGDRSSLERWFNWLGHHRPLASDVGHVRSLPRYCNDNACIMRPLDRDIDDAVFSAVVMHPPPDGIYNYYGKANELLVGGLLPLSFLAIPVIVAANVYFKMSVGDKLLLNTRVEIDGDALGFPLHLDAVRAWLLIKIQHPDAEKAREAIRIISSRLPRNPFYRFLAGVPVQALVDDVRNACRQSSSTGDVWLWEVRSIDEEMNRSMLWDCIFMRRLLGEAGKSLGTVKSPSTPAVQELLLDQISPR